MEEWTEFRIEVLLPTAAATAEFSDCSYDAGCCFLTMPPAALILLLRGLVVLEFQLGLVDATICILLPLFKLRLTVVE